MSDLDPSATIAAPSEDPNARPAAAVARQAQPEATPAVETHEATGTILLRYPAPPDPARPDIPLADHSAAAATIAANARRDGYEPIAAPDQTADGTWQIQVRTIEQETI